MGWDEIKKENNDLSVPLDILELILHIDLIGSEYDASENLELSNLLYQYPILADHPIAYAVISEVIV